MSILRLERITDEDLKSLGRQVVRELERRQEESGDLTVTPWYVTLGTPLHTVEAAELEQYNRHVEEARVTASGIGATTNTIRVTDNPYTWYGMFGS